MVCVGGQNLIRAEWDSLFLTHDSWHLHWKTSKMVAGIIWRLVYSRGWRLVLAVGGELSWGNWLEYLPMAYPSGLGFLTTCWLGWWGKYSKERERETETEAEKERENCKVKVVPILKHSRNGYRHCLSSLQPVPQMHFTGGTGAGHCF